MLQCVCVCVCLSVCVCVCVCKLCGVCARVHGGGVYVLPVSAVNVVLSLEGMCSSDPIPWAHSLPHAGSLAVVYSWSFDGIPFESSGERMYTQNGTLVFQLTSMNVGKFACLASTSQGTVSSRPAIIQIAGVCCVSCVGVGVHVCGVWVCMHACVCVWCVCVCVSCVGVGVHVCGVWVCMHACVCVWCVGVGVGVDVLVWVCVLWCDFKYGLVHCRYC